MNQSKPATPLLPLLPLGADEIHLWLAFDREITDSALTTAYRQLLTPEERQQEQRFYFAKDQHQYLVTRALTRTVLSRYAQVAPEDWRFNKLEHGRPEIANDDPLTRSLVFNISHTAGLIVLAVTRDQDLGVDTENILEREAPLDIANRYFSPRETADLYALPREVQLERFFHYWSLKESYIKARSKGLSIPLDQFNFTYADAHSIAVAFHEKLQDVPERWRFWLLKPTLAHLLAICVGRGTGDWPSQKIMLRKTIPLSGDEALTYTVLRESAGMTTQ